MELREEEACGGGCGGLGGNPIETKPYGDEEAMGGGEVMKNLRTSHRAATAIAPPPPPHQTASAAGEPRPISRVSSMEDVFLGMKRLAQRFVPMAFAPDGLIEGFYDPDYYNPEEGKFIMGLQFHPERMRRSDMDDHS
ncbi:hypothetical protein Drorol1_Dr00019940 [Drosera rotundifolia]